MGFDQGQNKFCRALNLGITSNTSPNSFVLPLELVPYSGAQAENNLKGEILAPIQGDCNLLNYSTNKPILAKVNEILNGTIPSLQDLISIRASPNQEVVRNICQNEYSGKARLNTASISMIESRNGNSRQTSWTWHTEYTSCKNFADSDGTAANSKLNNRILIGNMEELRENLQLKGNCDLTSLTRTQSKMHSHGEVRVNQVGEQGGTDCVCLQIATPEAKANHFGQVDTSYDHGIEILNSSRNIKGKNLHVCAVDSAEMQECNSVLDQRTEQMLSEIYSFLDKNIEELEKTTTIIQSTLNRSVFLNGYQDVHAHNLLLRNTMLQHREQQLMYQVAGLEDRLLKAAKLSADIQQSQNKIDEQKDRQIVALRLQLACALAQRMESGPKPQELMEKRPRPLPSKGNV
jgi:hypothetical protein